MSGRAQLMWDDAVTGYDFGDTHPMDPVRLAQDYVAAVRAASANPRAADQSYGLGTVDDPAFTGMHEASALIAGLSVGAAEAVWRGETEHAVNFTGGLHHAMPG
ncbi:acetoin utilization protein AcuC, partial [Streptomyces sp. BF-3]